MFALPGIVLLIAFVYLRPQEFIPILAKVPLLYLFFALAAFGLAVDVRIRVARMKATPQSWWVVAFVSWALATVAVFAPARMIALGIDLLIPVGVFALITLGVQSLRAYRILAWLLVGLSFCLALIGIHQGNAKTGCVQIDTETADDLSVGEFDGRSCETTTQCYGSQANPSSDYLCERIGLFGTTSIGRRVRYRGILQDPNELALAVSIGWALSFGLLGAVRRRRYQRYRWAVAISGIATAVCVVYTQSRGGMLVLLTVVGTFALWRYKWKGALVGILMALPLVVVASSGPERRDADASSEERLEAWATGVDLFFSKPLTGVGARQFTQHHFLTAHNSYILMAAELGFPGLFMFLTIFYLALKTSFLISVRYRGDPRAGPAVQLSDALFGATCGLAVGAFFLSLSYHMLMWIVFALSGALYSSVRVHDPSFRVRFGTKDLGAVLAGSVFLIVFMRLFLRFKGV